MHSLVCMKANVIASQIEKPVRFQYANTGHGTPAYQEKKGCVQFAYS